MNTTYKFLLPIAVLATILLSSCELYNPAEPIPSYIHIQKFTLTTTSLQGSNSHKITDAWVYVDDQIIGCFELPATIPILAEGNHKIKISPGIKVNGIAADRAQYPFFTSHEQDVDFQIGTTITLTPNVTYKPTTSFVFMEDFEMPGTQLSRTTTSDTAMEYVTSPYAFETGTSLIGYTDPTRFRFECRMTDSVSLPKGGSPVFLEFNYKCNHHFTVSVIAIGSGGQTQFSALNLNPSANWNKIYVYLTPIVSGAYTATGYKVEWGLHNTGMDSAVVLLDNIKLIK